MTFRAATRAVAFLALGLLACNLDSVLTVPDPGVATPQSVQDSSALPIVLAGAIGDFQVAYSGQQGVDGQVAAAALLTDEFIWAEVSTTRLEMDIRSIQPTNSLVETLFRNLHRARASANRAAEGFAQFARSAPGFAEALNLEGMTYLLFGENFCSGVPFSRLTPTGATEYGAPRTTTEMFGAALVRFDSALTVLGANSAAAAQLQANVARVGRGRALLNLDRPAEAAVAVAGVPTGFVYRVLHSENSARQYNGVYSLVYESRRLATGEREGGNGLPFHSDGASDPRIPNVRGTGGSAIGLDGVTPIWLQQKYPARNSPATVANGTEARLLEAEAALRAGDPGWIVKLNALRASVGLSPLLDPVTPSSREDLLFKERAYWLWLTSHRLGDLRRLVRQYNRSAESVFPTGSYFKGGQYGSDVNFPIPFTEQNNPNSRGCLDRGA